MTIKNKYVKRSKISEAKFRLLLRYFVHDLEAKTIAALTHLNRNTVNRYLTLIRKRIAVLCEQQSPVQGEIEVDESYFGGKRIKGKRGRGAYRKTPVFVSLNEGVKYTPKSSRIARKPRCKASYVAVWILIASSTPMGGVDTMAL